MNSREELLSRVKDAQKKVIQIGTIDVPAPKGIKHNDYREEIEKAKPSDKPSYWAKPGCKDCCGTGIYGMKTREVGDGNKLTTSQICSCASKNWKKWQEEFVEKLRSKNINTAEEPTQLHLPCVETVTEFDPGKAIAMERIENIMNRVGPIHDTVCALEEQFANLPQRRVVSTAVRTVEQLELEVREAELHATSKESRAQQLETEAEHYRMMAKEAIRQAAAIRQQKNIEILPQVNLLEAKLKDAKQKLGQAEHNLSRVEHQVRKKIRENEKKRDRLNKRIDRIREEYGLDDPVFIAKTAETSPSHDNLPSD